MSLGFPLSVRSRNFCFFLSQQGERGCGFAVVFARIPQKGILDFVAHGSTIQDFMVAWSGGVYMYMAIRTVSFHFLIFTSLSSLFFSSPSYLQSLIPRGSLSK